MFQYQTRTKHPMAKPQFRTRLAEIRERKGMSRMDIVRGTRMTYPTVMKWESHGMSNLNAEHLSALLKLLNVTYEDLIYLVEDEEVGDTEEERA